MTRRETSRGGSWYQPSASLSRRLKHTTYRGIHRDARRGDVTRDMAFRISRGIELVNRKGSRALICFVIQGDAFLDLNRADKITGGIETQRKVI